jgi:predicted nucleic acid-binding protein
LIYLAKIGALEALWACGPVLVTTGVREEAVLPRAAFRFPEVVEIEAAMTRGLIEVTTMTTRESELANSIEERVPALGRGEREVIAVSIERSLDAVMFDRRARRVARALDASVVDMFEVVFRGTRNAELLERRVRDLASLVDLRIGALEELLDRVGPKR